MKEPLRCQILCDAPHRMTQLQSYVHRLQRLVLVEPPQSADVLIWQPTHPAIGLLIMGKNDNETHFSPLKTLSIHCDYLDFASAIENVYAMLQPASREPPPASGPYFFIKSDYKLIRIDVERILYIEGMKNYAKIYLAGVAKPILTLSSLKALMQKLPSSDFFRIHRSYIIHLRYLHSFEKGQALIGSVRLPIAEKKRPQISALSGQGVKRSISS